MYLNNGADNHGLIARYFTGDLINIDPNNKIAYWANKEEESNDISIVNS